MNDVLVRNVRPLHAGAVDLLVRDGRIAEVALGVQADDAQVIDGAGRLIFPGFVDAHAHMDKTLLGLGWYVNDVPQNLRSMIDNEREMRLARGIDSHTQSSKQARLALAAGTTHIRTFVDIDTGWGLSGFEGVAQTREDFRGALDIQIVAFPQSGMLVRPGTVELMEDALRNGADVVGGLDPSTIDRDPARHLDVVFGMAERYDKDVDIHLHEPGDLGAFSVELIAERTKVLGWQGRVVISHAFSLGGVDDAHLGKLIDLLLENDIAIMSHGPSGGRPAPPVARLAAAGVRLCTGNDGIRDAWGPLNMPDMLLRTFLVAYRNNFRRDADLELALHISTYGSAQVVGAAEYGLAPGAAADFVLLPGENHLEAIIERPKERLVVKGGRVVAEGGVALV
ncbi:MAG: cytosine deaminase [Chloroflexi bacterium]|nr:MAG: cytosine deaminase [Chloroflexota bacterium]